MGLLQRAAGEKIAGRLDALLAWTQVISEVAAESFPLLLSGFSDHRALASRIGQSLRELCALLAEAGLTPSLRPARCVSSPQEDRWKELKALYEQYLNRLAAAGLEDSDAAHIRVAKMGIVPENIEHVIVAGVPDLNPISEAYLRILESAGVAVTVSDRCARLRTRRVRCLGEAGPESLVAEIPSAASRRLCGRCRPGVGGAIVARLIGSAAVGVCVADSELIPFHLRAMQKGVWTLRSCGQIVGALRVRDLGETLACLCFEWSGQRTSNSRGASRFLRLLCREAHQPLRPSFRRSTSCRRRSWSRPWTTRPRLLAKAAAAASSMQRPDCRGGEAQANIRRVWITRRFA